MNEVWFVVWTACFVSLAVVIGGALVLVSDWMHHKQDDEPRQTTTFVAEPTTVKIGHPLYDQDQEEAP